MPVPGIFVRGGATPPSGAARETKIPGVPWLYANLSR
jgi:hypothetical protein